MGLSCDVAGSSCDVAGLSCDVAGSSCGVAGSSCDVAGLSRDVAGSSCDVAGSSCDVAGSSCDVAGLSCVVAGSSCGVAGLSCDVAGLSCDVAGLSCDVAGSSCDVAGSSCDVAGLTPGAVGWSAFVAESAQRLTLPFMPRATTLQPATASRGLLGLLRAQVLGVRAVSKRRRAVALSVAVCADLVQLVLWPAFAGGVASPFEDVLDVVVAAVLWLTLGFSPRLALAFALELVPGADLFPTWSAVVFSVPTVEDPPPAGADWVRPRG